MTVGARAACYHSRGDLCSACSKAFRNSVLCVDAEFSQRFQCSTTLLMLLAAVCKLAHAGALRSVLVIVLFWLASLGSAAAVFMQLVFLQVVTV